MTLDPAIVNLLRSIQNKIEWRDREHVARVIAQATAARTSHNLTGQTDSGLLAELRTTGICKLPSWISHDSCREIVQYFESTPCYGAHVPAYSDGVMRPVEVVAAHANYGSYSLEQSLRAPGLIEIALDARVLDVVAAYLGCLPYLYSINTFWTFPANETGLSHDYHRDEDDFRFVAVFIYWTDVEAGEGEFLFLEQTHNHQFVARRVMSLRGSLAVDAGGEIGCAEAFRRLNGGNGYRNNSLYDQLFPNDARRVEGKAGNMFAADTFALHRGALPKSRRRLCTWLRYGMYANEAYRIDRTEPIPASRIDGRIADSAANRHVTQLIVDWSR